MILLSVFYDIHIDDIITFCAILDSKTRIHEKTPIFDGNINNDLITVYSLICQGGF
jgi:hypothetical protein